MNAEDEEVAYHFADELLRTHAVSDRHTAARRRSSASKAPAAGRRAGGAAALRGLAQAPPAAVTGRGRETGGDPKR